MIWIEPLFLFLFFCETILWSLPHRNRLVVDQTHSQEGNRHVQQGVITVPLCKKILLLFMGHDYSLMCELDVPFLIGTVTDNNPQDV